mgnify:CR=1 FL=1
MAATLVVVEFDRAPGLLPALDQAEAADQQLGARGDRLHVVAERAVAAETHAVRGVEDERHAFVGKPLIGVLNTWSELNTCHSHFPERVEDVM